MNRFIACGVPRSGTTALASLLNWHPGVFCGIERFPLAVVDQSYFTRDAIGDPSIPTAHFERNLEILNQKSSLDALGDKGPRYFYRLAGSREAFAGMKLIFIIRNLPEVFNSWNQRAFNPEDKSWHRGQSGVFAYLDTLQLMFALNRVKSSHEGVVLGYEQLFYGSEPTQRGIIDRLLAFLGAPVLAEVHQRFDAESAKRRSLSKRGLKLSPQEYEFIEFVKLDALAETLANSNGLATPAALSTVCSALLDDFYSRQREILAAVETLLRPQSGVSQAITIMRYCYEMSGTNHIYSVLGGSNGAASTTFELLANVFNARQAGDFEAARAAGENLMERFPDCPELCVEMSELSELLKDRKSALEYTRRAAALRPGNEALFKKLRALTNKLTGSASDGQGLVKAESGRALDLADAVTEEREREPPNRIQIIKQGLKLEGVGLEIGPLHKPVVRKSESRVFYLDRLSTQGLRDRYQQQPHVDIGKIVDVDFVLVNGRVNESVPDDLLFDYVIASHVIQCVPDLVRYLRSISGVLRPGGILSLAIPDKRYCFDLLKQETTLGEVLQAFHAEQSRPGFSHVFNHFSNVVEITAPEAWAGTSSETLRPLHDLEAAYGLACKSQIAGAYIDVHCWAFTPGSFVKIFEALLQLGLIDLVITRTTETRQNTNEFFVQLVRRI